MIGYFTADAVRDAEKDTGALLTSGVLMRRAAGGLSHVVADELLARTSGVYGRRVGLVIGSGDNGGDALYAGAALARRGVSVSAVLLDPDHAHPGGRAAFTEAGGRVVSTLPSDIDVAVDGVVGLRGHGPLRPAAAAVFAQITAPIVAVDVPSGVDADTGLVNEPSVSAATTVTFGMRRHAHILAAPSCGRVEVVDIGLTDPVPDLVELSDAEVAAMWPIPGPDDNKYTQGVTGIIAGSAKYPGAAILCTGGAVAATSGMVRYCGSAAGEVVSHHAEVIAAPDLDSTGRVQAWVIGPGAGTDDAAEELLERILGTDLPVLVDADGLTVLARRPDLVRSRTAPTLLTPHAGEFERLAGHEVGTDRLAAVRGLAADLGATVLLKGRITLIADDRAEQVIANDARTSWSATAGAGDVLSGIAGSLLAAGLEPRLAAAAAARVHALAAAMAARGAPIGASQLVAGVSPALRALLAGDVVSLRGVAEPPA
ncbi:NAD(P)H-hydrate dehydratase [Gordonia jinhuaensis]|uniref:ADP-dependent (S)-NAD(P)H-hydrate dehydratase n=1 Tax=Gordonia jinhuaensis TaxID=1517702 RepID=A0A916SWK5_9ACTN|nr:bifunctional NAD(P)H-hydrate repair enzyme Nnr [Gordonia jinhuaensis]